MSQLIQSINLNIIDHRKRQESVTLLTQSAVIAQGGEGGAGEVLCEETAHQNASCV